MRRLRQVVQLLSLALFIGLVGLTLWPLPTSLPPSLLLRLDPLAGLAAALSAARSWDLLTRFWPALVLLGATLLLGRFFCGWLCPLGTSLDLSDRLFRRRRRRMASSDPTEGLDRSSPPEAPRSAGRPYAWLKYVLLALIIGAALAGAQVWLWLDPLSLFTRTLATVVFPALAALYNGFVALSEPLRELLVWRLDPVRMHVFRLNLLVAGVFVAIAALGHLSRRFWCRNLCPLGALLALLGRYGLWRRRVDASACTTCGRCAAQCKMDALAAADPATTRQADCVQCYGCLDCCGPGATALTVGSGAPGAITAEVDLSRRQFLTVVAAGAGYGLLTVSGWGRRPWDERLIRPPGAVVRDEQGHFLRLMTEGELRAKCVRCGQCLKVCPTGGLQPAVSEAGLDGFYTPVLVPRAGWCEQNCVACGDVCPSGALVPFTVEEKTEIRIGLAALDRDKCLAWREGDEYAQCTVCNEYCSYGAVGLRPVNGHDRPHVIDHKCVGCGICEKACPLKPRAAIVVHRRGTLDEL